MKVTRKNILNKWKEVPDHWVNPIWSGKFAELKPSDYGDPNLHGRFHPEIPYVMIGRYTNPGDLIWDPCAGGDTTGDVIRGHYPNRISYSTDLNPTVDTVEPLEASSFLCDEKRKDLKLIIFHPPYYDIVKYSDDKFDACNQPNFQSYKIWLNKCLNNYTIVLKKGGHLVVVIGEIYKDGSVIPLEYEVNSIMREHMRERGFALKGRIIKDFGETKAVGKNSNLWKYRCIKNENWRLGIDTILVYKKEK